MPSPELRPVFIPSLAELLARAENKKGTALSVAEMHSVRDRGTCVMMRTEDARQMDQSRGYHDVNPENCLADWNRLRTQVTGRGYLPKLILCVPGDERFRAQCEPLLQQVGAEYEFRGRDDRMVPAFEASRFLPRPSLHAPEFEAIARHSSVLYVLSESFPPQKAPAVSHDFLRLGQWVLDAGGIAIKCESSGVAHSASHWRELMAQSKAGSESAPHHDADTWSALFSAYVQFPIQSDTDFYSCGLHLLGQPDLIVSRALMHETAADGRSPAHQAAELFNVFGIYLIAECGDAGFTSGHTFSSDSESRRYRIIWEPCTGYDEDEFFFNPYGRWRFVNP